MSEELKQFYEAQERQAHLEHQDVLLAMRAVLNTNEGVKLFKYLFKHFEVASVPERGLSNDDLQEYLGFLRAGNSIFKLTSEACSEISSKILAELERKRHESICEQYRIENGIKTR